MIGVDVLAGAAVGYLSRKVRRVATRADGDLDMLLDEAVDRLERVVFQTLGYRHPALMELYNEAETGHVSRVAELHARRAIADAADTDDGFARQLDRAISDLRARESGTTISAQHGGAAVGDVHAKDGGTAIAILNGPFSITNTLSQNAVAGAPPSRSAIKPDGSINTEGPGIVIGQMHQQRLVQYDKAIDQLGSSQPWIVAGGIRALGMIMAELAPDELGIPQQLTDVIRAHATDPGTAVIEDGPASGPDSFLLTLRVAFTTAQLEEQIKDASRHPRKQGKPQAVPRRLSRSARNRPLDPVVQAAMAVLAKRPIGPESPPLNLRQVHLAGLSLEPDAHFGGTYFTGANLSQARLPRADLSGAWFRGTSLTNARLPGADLSHARMSQSDLAGAVLQNANLTETALTLAYLPGADLYQADMAGAYMTYADLSKVRLSKAVLRGAWLMAANLEQADVWETDFTDAYLHGADLRRAVGLTVEQLLQAVVDETTKVDRHLDSDRRYAEHLRRCRALMEEQMNNKSLSDLWRLKNLKTHHLRGAMKVTLERPGCAGGSYSNQKVSAQTSRFRPPSVTSPTRLPPDRARPQQEDRATGR